VGSKKNPIWRVVVADQRSPRDGRFIETIGHYNPQTEPSTIRIDAERLDHWLARGAQATNTVKQLMKAQTKAGGPTPLDAPAATAVAEAPEPEAPEAPEAEAATPEEEAPAPAPEAEAAPEEQAAEADAGEDEPSS
jgi:small subunit ribosomal protein S16